MCRGFYHKHESSIEKVKQHSGAYNFIKNASSVSLRDYGRKRKHGVRQDERSRLDRLTSRPIRVQGDEQRHADRLRTRRGMEYDHGQRMQRDHLHDV